MSRDSRFLVLVVCTGNTCRSPLAALALEHELAADDPRVVVASAGTSAWTGQPASEGSLTVAAADGLDLSAHRSRRLTSAIASEADLVFVMEPAHRAAVEAAGVPGERVHVLSDWPPPGEPGLPISDPFGASREAYEECWRRIRLHARRVAPHVLAAARAQSTS